MRNGSLSKYFMIVSGLRSIFNSMSSLRNCTNSSVQLLSRSVGYLLVMRLTSSGICEASPVLSEPIIEKSRAS